MSKAAYIEHRRAGAFPNQIDPWAEIGQFFKQIHALMIDCIILQINDPLAELGYIVSRETSLQITIGQQPDILVNREVEARKNRMWWDYDGAAEAILANPGISVKISSSDEQNIVVKDENNQVITIVELISPRNKTHNTDIRTYRRYRQQLVEAQGVNVVEIDLTRSVKRLFQTELTQKHAYHYAIFIPDQPIRVSSFEFGDALPRLALPLQGEVVGVEPHGAYKEVYRIMNIAAQIDSNHYYTAATLPFPSLLTEEQRQQCWERVAAWQTELERLRQA